MKKKIITLGMLCMFLLTSLLVGTAIGEKTTKATSTEGTDLSITVQGVKGQYEDKYDGISAEIKNVGTMVVSGSFKVTLTIRLPFLGIIPIHKETWTVQLDLAPGESVFEGLHYPTGFERGFSISIFQYRLSPAIFEEIKNLRNNNDSQRVLSLGSYMYFIGS